MKINTSFLQEVLKKIAVLEPLTAACVVNYVPALFFVWLRKIVEERN